MPLLMTIRFGSVVTATGGAAARATAANISKQQTNETVEIGRRTTLLPYGGINVFVSLTRNIDGTEVLKLSALSVCLQRLQHAVEARPSRRQAALARVPKALQQEIGRASCRERVE